MTPKELEDIPAALHNDFSEAIDTAPHIPPRFYDLGKVYWKGRQWVVNDHGIERHDGKAYQIPVEDIRNLQPWDFERLRNKLWIDFEDFLAAYRFALLLLDAGRIGPSSPRHDQDNR